jgi:hypothetical protein
MLLQGIPKAVRDYLNPAWATDTIVFTLEESTDFLLRTKTKALRDQPSQGIAAA